MRENLKAKIRKIKGRKVKNIREQGKLPAILYGVKTTPTPLEVELNEFQNVLDVAGMSSLIDLKINNGSKQETKIVLIQDVDYDPRSSLPRHADLRVIDLKKKIRTHIPIETKGESLAVKELEGTLITVKDNVEIEALPTDLVSHISVDLSKLKTFEDTIKVSDLNLPEGIEVLDQPDETIILVQEPRSEEELEQLDEEVSEDVESVEVEEKGKEKDEENEESAQTSDTKDKEQGAPAENDKEQSEKPDSSENKTKS